MYLAAYLDKIKFYNNMGGLMMDANVYMTKEELYEKYPRKWILISNPQSRESDGELVGGEFVGVFDTMEAADRAGGISGLNLKSAATINSIQEE